MTDTSAGRINRRAAIEAMPRVQWACGRDWMRGHNTYEVGAYWDKDVNAGEGFIVYRRWLVFRFSFGFGLYRCFTRAM